jgi:hypothetical protein
MGQPTGLTNSFKLAYWNIFYGSIDRLEAQDLWLNIVSTYSKLLLTSETDRLPALSGLTSQFSVVVQSEYLAGL